MVDGKKIYLKREDEFLYTGRRFQIPKVTAARIISSNDEPVITLLCQGKDVHKIKITDDGVAIVKNDGKTEEIPVIPGEDIETLEGVFFKSVGKKLPINFQNNTGISWPCSFPNIISNEIII